MLLVAYGISNNFAIDINDNRVAEFEHVHDVRFEFVHTDSLKPNLFVDASRCHVPGWEYRVRFPDGHKHDDAIPVVTVSVSLDRDSLALSADVYDVWIIRVLVDGRYAGYARNNAWFHADARAA